MKLLALIVILPLGVSTIPWIVWALVCAFAGDEDAYERAMDNCPLAWWLDWVESRA